MECGPLDRLSVLYLGASVFDLVGWGLRRGAAVLGYHREGDGLVLGVPPAPVESPFRLGAGVPRHCGCVTLCGLFEVRA